MVAINMTPFVIGHRGAAGHAPENTLSSIRKAHELGATWVEIDVKLSADGSPVIFHDDALDRTTDGSGNVADFDLRSLQGLDAGRWFGGGYFGERIPTLSEMVDALRELGLGLNLELKPCPGREVETAEIVARQFRVIWPDQLPPPVVSSFSLDSLYAFQKQSPDIVCAPLFSKLPRDWLMHAERLNADAVHLGLRRLKRADVDAVQRSGCAVRIYTVNDIKTAARLSAWGVQSIFSDFPDRVLNSDA